MSKPGLHLINVSSLSFIKKKIFFSNFKFFKYSYTTGYGVFYWLLTQWGSFFTLCLLIQWEYNLWIFIIKIFWEHVDWNYPQFHTEFVGIKILSPLSSIRLFLPLFPYFSINFIFHKPENCRFIHSKYFCQFTLFFNWIIHIYIAIFLCSSNISCRLPAIENKDITGELKQGGQMRSHSLIIFPSIILI